jgi:hypothetical protein
MLKFNIQLKTPNKQVVWSKFLKPKVNIILKKKIFPKMSYNLRNRQFKLVMLPNLKKLISFQDLPIDYKLLKFRYIRLVSRFYGLNYDSNTVNYKL